MVSLVVGFTLTPMILAIQARKTFSAHITEHVVVERPFSEKPLVRRFQLDSRWMEAKWRVVAQFLFRDIASVLLTDLRGVWSARWAG